jgi:hypothetical protein
MVLMAAAAAMDATICVMELDTMKLAIGVDRGWSRINVNIMLIFEQCLDNTMQYFLKCDIDKGLSNITRPDRVHYLYSETCSQ